MSKKQMPKWKYPYPNDPDFNFNYSRLVGNDGWAKSLRPNLRIAIVGAGAAGATVASELHSMGFKSVDLFEQTNRIGGRIWSIPAPGQKYTTFEMGGMRFPFFPQLGSNNSLHETYSRKYGITYQEFPNPGTDQCDSGWIFNCTSYPEAIKYYRKNIPLPEDPILRKVMKRFFEFKDFVVSIVSSKYEEDDWTEFWKKVVVHYWDKTFFDLCHLPHLSPEEYDGSGYFGGLGFSEDQSRIFYSSGVGDGGWGAVYHISLLYIFRVAFFGYTWNLKMCQGRFHSKNEENDKGPCYLGKEFNPGPFCDQEYLMDSANSKFLAPKYLGTQALIESFIFICSKNQELSFYESTKSDEYNNHLFMNSLVVSIDHNEKTGTNILKTKNGIEKIYDAIFLTGSNWTMQKLFDRMTGFTKNGLIPPSIPHAISISHQMVSTKVFVGLKERYWEKEGSKIPQVIVYDDFLQQSYGVACDVPYPEKKEGEEGEGETEEEEDDDMKRRKDAGVLLICYTWEDDSIKLLHYDDQELVDLCVEKMDRNLMRSENIRQKISPYIDKSNFQVVHWAKERTSLCLCKLYRPKAWNRNQKMLKFNQQYSKKSGIYFCGAAFHTASGWIEPAFRMAIDAILHLGRNFDGVIEVNKDLEFVFDRDYPQYTDWSPDWNNSK